MEAVLLKGNSVSDIELIIALARKLDVQITTLNSIELDNLNQSIHSKKNGKHDFFNSKGMWKDRAIDAKKLRNEVWKIQD